jgi:hypothetical protein
MGAPCSTRHGVVGTRWMPLGEAPHRASHRGRAALTRSGGAQQQQTQNLATVVVESLYQHALEGAGAVARCWM